MPNAVHAGNVAQQARLAVSVKQCTNASGVLMILSVVVAMIKCLHQQMCSISQPQTSRVLKWVKWVAHLLVHTQPFS
jgi:hypothetical protein